MAYHKWLNSIALVLLTCTMGAPFWTQTEITFIDCVYYAGPWGIYADGCEPFFSDGYTQYDSDTDFSNEFEAWRGTRCLLLTHSFASPV